MHTASLHDQLQVSSVDDLMAFIMVESCLIVQSEHLQLVLVLLNSAEKLDLIIGHFTVVCLVTWP